MLKKVLHYNDVSDEVIKSIPKLKKGETVRFKCVHINPDPKNERKFSGPRFYSIPAFDQIWDEKEGRYTDIGYVSRTVTTTGEEIAKPKKVIFPAPVGEIRVRGGVAEEEYLYYYLSLSNHNGSNLNRDQTVGIAFVKIDVEQAAKEKNTKRSKKFDALLAANSMTTEQIKDFVAATGGDDKQAIDILKDYVFDWADKSPEDFLLKLNDAEATTKAVIKRALDQGVINFSGAELLFTWSGSGEKIASVPRADGIEHIKYLSDLLLSDKRYEKVLPTIKKSLKGSKQAS